MSALWEVEAGGSEVPESSSGTQRIGGQPGLHETYLRNLRNKIVLGIKVSGGKKRYLKILSQEWEGLLLLFFFLARSHSIGQADLKITT